MAAVHAGDVTELTRLLHPQAALFGDSGGKVSSARRPILGADKIGRFAVGLAAKYGTSALEEARPVLVNGDLGVLVPGDPADVTGRTSARRVLARHEQKHSARTT